MRQSTREFIEAAGRNQRANCYKCKHGSLFEGEGTPGILVTAPTLCLRMDVMQTSAKPIPPAEYIVGPTPQVALTVDQTYHSRRRRCCVFTDSGTGITVR